jgi:hypothetical protein
MNNSEHLLSGSYVPHMEYVLARLNFQKNVVGTMVILTCEWAQRGEVTYLPRITLLDINLTLLLLELLIEFEPIF